MLAEFGGAETARAPPMSSRSAAASLLSGVANPGAAFRFTTLNSAVETCDGGARRLCLRDPPAADPDDDESQLAFALGHEARTSPLIPPGSAIGAAPQFDRRNLGSCLAGPGRRGRQCVAQMSRSGATCALSFSREQNIRRIRLEPAIWSPPAMTGGRSGILSARPGRRRAIPVQAEQPQTPEWRAPTRSARTGCSAHWPERGRPGGRRRGAQPRQSSSPRSRACSRRRSCAGDHRRAGPFTHPDLRIQFR